MVKKMKYPVLKKKLMKSPLIFQSDAWN